MPANNADFNGINYRHLDSGRLGARVIAEHPEHGYVGHMLLLGLRGGSGRKIRDISVKPEFQRQGIATGMYRYAEAAGLKPKHSDQRTDQGEAWARSLGVRLPRRDSGIV